MEPIDAVARCVPLLGAVAFIGITLGYRGLRFRRQWGYSPFRLPAGDDVSAHAFLARVLVVVLALMVLMGVLVAVAPEALEAVDPLFGQRSLPLLAVGVVVLAAAIGVVWRAQLDMAESWRVGMAESERTALVTRGLFRFCRNPIYLGLQLALLAWCLLIPGYATLTMLLIGLLLLQVQSRLEEAYLLAKHGEPYADYCRRVGRFLPWTGRWPAHTAPESNECKR